MRVDDDGDEGDELRSEYEMSDASVAKSTEQDGVRPRQVICFAFMLSDTNAR